jgi:hypothetical protein
VLGACRYVLTAALVATSLLGSAACGGDDGDDPSVEAETDETTAADAESAAEAEVVEAYEATWLNLIEAGDPADPESASLDDHTTGQTLENFRTYLERIAAEGVIVRGTYEFDAEVVELSDDRAVVEDCGLDQMEGILAATDEVVEPFDDERDGLVAELVYEESAWKVTTITDDPQVCES